MTRHFASVIWRVQGRHATLRADTQGIRSQTIQEASQHTLAAYRGFIRPQKAKHPRNAKLEKVVSN